MLLQLPLQLVQKDDSDKARMGREKDLGGIWDGVKIKIYILMEKVPHRPWVRHWFELQSILRLRCWELPQQQQTTGLTSAVFILLFNKKWQCSVNRYTASHVGQTKRNRDPCLSILSPSRSPLSHSLTSSHFNLFFPFKGRMAPGPQVLSITLGVVVVRPRCKQGCVTMNNIILRSTKICQYLQKVPCRPQNTKLNVGDSNFKSEILPTTNR